MYRRLNNSYNFDMNRKMIMIPTKSIEFPNELEHFYAIIIKNKTQLPFLIVCKHNEKYISLYPNINLEIISKKELNCLVINEVTTKKQLIKTFFDHHTKLTYSIYDILKCIKFISKLFNNSKEIIKFLPAFNITPDQDYLRQLQMCNNLHPKLLEFCETKKYNLKQLNQLCFTNKIILDIFINALPNLHFTARSFFEIIDQASDLLKRQTLTAPDLTYIINKALQSKKLSPHDKTNQIKQKLLEYTYPILTKRNNEIKHKINKINDLKKMDISWDKTLENKGIKLTINLEDKEDIKEIITFLKYNENNLNKIIAHT